MDRLAPRGEALLVLSLDDPAPPAVLAELKALDGVSAARLIDLG
jgi:hypothetical protein